MEKDAQSEYIITPAKHPSNNVSLSLSLYMYII